MPLDDPKPLTARIEVFRPGTFTPMEGAPITYSAADLRAIADAYDGETAPAPIVVGHPAVDAPAYGWVDSFDYDTAAERLFANLRDIDPAFAELVKAGRFRKVSMAYFSPEQGHNPVPGTWYPKHVGFLGAAAPAVPGLKNAHFAGEAGVVFTARFGRESTRQIAGLLRGMRDFIIDRFGLEDADAVLPGWQIDWIEEAEEAEENRRGAFAASGGAVQPEADPLAPSKSKPTKPAEKDITVSQPTDAEFAAREAAMAEREKRIADREAVQVHSENVAFAEALVSDGKLLPASRDKVVAILDALPSEASVSFAAGEAKIAPAVALKQVLEAQPKVVSFGAMDLPDGEGGGKPAAFAADGKAIDTEALATHQKAEAYMRQHPDIDYMSAVRAVS